MSVENNVKNTIDKKAGDSSENELPGLETELSEKAEGLMFPSESERPIEVISFEKDAAQSLQETYPDKTDQIVKNNFDDFYNKYAVKKDWQNDLQKEFAAQFAVVLDVMKKDLKDIEVFRVGEVNIDVYIVGRSMDERWVGIKTSVVET